MPVFCGLEILFLVRQVGGAACKAMAEDDVATFVLQSVRSKIITINNVE